MQSQILILADRYFGQIARNDPATVANVVKAWVGDTKP